MELIFYHKNIDYMVDDDDEGLTATRLYTVCIIIML